MIAEARMRVVIATGLYAPEIGGPATHTAMLERLLPGKGIDVSVIPFSRVRHLPPIVRQCGYAWYLFKAAQGASVLFSQDAVSCGLPSLIAARLARVPLIVRIPGDYAWEQARERWMVRDSVLEFQKKRYSFQIEILRFLQTAVVRSADLTIVPSSFLATFVSEWKPRALRVINNGTDLPEQPIQMRTESDRPRLITASRLIKGKGFEALIRLMPDLPEWELVIAGSGPLENMLKNMAGAFGVRDRVVFTGALSQDDLFDWYRKSDVFVLNSEFESFSFLVIEALALGMPTIATRVGAIPEILEDGTDGILVSPNDAPALIEAIQSVRKDRETWARRVENGRRAAQKFSSARTVEAFAEAFRSV